MIEICADGSFTTSRCHAVLFPWAQSSEAHSLTLLDPDRLLRCQDDHQNTLDVRHERQEACSCLLCWLPSGLFAGLQHPLRRCCDQIRLGSLHDSRVHVLQPAFFFTLNLIQLLFWMQTRRATDELIIRYRMMNSMHCSAQGENLEQN